MLILKEKAKLEDLVYTTIYWNIIWLKISGKNPGLTPGFEGYMWLKETFPNKFDFLKTVKIEVPDGDSKPSRGQVVQRGPRGRARVFLNNVGESQEAQAESTEMNFPSLGGDARPGELTLEQRVVGTFGNKKGLAITGKKVRSIHFIF